MKTLLAKLKQKILRTDCEKEQETTEFPNAEQLKVELQRIQTKRRFFSLLKSTIFTLIVVSAVAVLVAVFFIPVFRIYGSSMSPTLSEGEIVVSIKTDNIKCGDVVGVYYGSKLLIKCCIGVAGQWIDIDKNGNIYVDRKLINEPYITEKSLGKCNIKLPYQDPDNAIFVLGDNRSTSIDSRNTSVGCIELDNVAGKVVFCVFPFSNIGFID